MLTVRIPGQETWADCPIQRGTRNIGDTGAGGGPSGRKDSDVAVADYDLLEQEAAERSTRLSVITDCREQALGLARRMRPTNPTVSVVVPTLNEARNLPYAFSRLPECVTEILLVDGRSRDDTVEVAQSLRDDVRVVMEPEKGKGAALKRGFAEATGDIIVMFDADGSADGGEMQRYVDTLVAGADFAKGSRFMPGGGSVDITRIRSLGNLAICAAVNLACNTRFTDVCYGYNAFWRDTLQFVEVDVSGFEIETRFNMMVATAGLIVVEVPSFEFSRVHGDSNLSAVKDGFRVLRTIATSTRDIAKGRRTVRDTQPSLYEQTL